MRWVSWCASGDSTPEQTGPHKGPIPLTSSPGTSGCADFTLGRHSLPPSALTEDRLPGGTSL